jgi:hypothetical protein
MSTKTELTSQIIEDHKLCDSESTNEDDALRFKKRMLEWPNPVEYVNNMYGCHPDDDDNEYFKVIFAK